MQAYGGYGGGPQMPRAAGGIRHAYPLTVTSASFGRAFLLNLRTIPYVFVRFFLHLVHAVVAAAMIGGAIAGGVLVGNKVSPWAGIVAFVGGLLVYSALWAWWFRYLLYAVKCGHVAVLTDLVTRGKIGDGTEGMLAYGSRTVRERFGNMAQVYALQQMIRLAVLEFNMGLGIVGDFLPFGLGILTLFVRRLLRASTRYLDETMFSYSLLRRNEPLWDVVSEGMGYYFQNAREMLKTSVWMMFIDFFAGAFLWIALAVACGFAVYTVALPLASAHAAELQSALGSSDPDFDSTLFSAVLAAIVGGVFFGTLATSAVKHAFFHPVYLTMIMTKFLVLVQSQPLDPSFQNFLGTPRAVSLRNMATGIDAARLARR